MYIGALSKMTGVSRKTIHHYESIGLIPVPQRKGRYRVYSETDADLIFMIRRAKSLGFSLKEVKELASTRASIRECPTGIVLALISAKRKELGNTIGKAKLQDQQLADLQADLLKTRRTSRG